MAFQRASWRAQRVGWAGIGLVIALAALGLFSSGPISERDAHAEGFSISHQRIVRNEAAATLTITLHGPEIRNEIIISPSVARAMTVETIVPQPIWSEARADGLHLVIAAPPNGDRVVDIGLRPREVGVVNGSIRLAGGGQTAFSIIILP
jgi:hypothetical protein